MAVDAIGCVVEMPGTPTIDSKPLPILFEKFEATSSSPSIVIPLSGRGLDRFLTLDQYLVD